MTDQRNTHPLNVSYLVVGLVLLGIAATWALRASGTVAAGQTHWLIPATLVGAGLVGLLAIALRARSRGGRPALDDASALEDRTDRLGFLGDDRSDGTDGDIEKTRIIEGDQ